MYMYVNENSPYSNSNYLSSTVSTVILLWCSIDNYMYNCIVITVKPLLNYCNVIMKLHVW